MSLKCFLLSFANEFFFKVDLVQRVHSMIAIMFFSFFHLLSCRLELLFVVIYLMKKMTITLLYVVHDCTSFLSPSSDYRWLSRLYMEKKERRDRRIGERRFDLINAIFISGQETHLIFFLLQYRMRKNKLWLVHFNFLGTCIQQFSTSYENLDQI